MLVASLSTRPCSSSTPQWPWSVNSSRHVSAMTTRSSPTASRTARSATLRMPSGSTAPEPVASLCWGTPKSMIPPNPAATQRWAISTTLSRVWCSTPGMLAIGRGSVMPSATKTGSTRSRGCSRVSATRDRRTGFCRRRRGRSIIGAPPSAGAASRRGTLVAGTLHRLARLCRGDGETDPVPCERVDEAEGRRLRREDVDPEAVLLRRLGRGRSDAGNDRCGVRLSGDADEVAHRRARGEEHRVVVAALDRVADVRGRRGGTHGAVGGDVVDLPAHVAQTGDQGLGRDVGAGQQDPVDRVEGLVELGPRLEQAGRRLLARGDEVGVDAPLTEGGRSDATDGGDLEAGEGAGVEAELLEALPHGAHGVDRGEADPLVAAGDEALDGLLHLLRRARRLDRDGGHDVRGRAVAGEALDHRAGLGLGARDEDLPPEERLGLEPGELVTQGDGGRHDGERHRERLLAGEDGVGLAQGRGDGRLAHRGAVGRQRHERVRGPAGSAECGERAPDALGAAEQHERVGVGRVGGEVDARTLDTDDVDGPGGLRRQGDTGIRGPGGEGRHSRHDVVGDAGLAAGAHLLDEAVEGRGVAVHETDDEPPGGHGLRRLDDELGAHRVGELLALLAVAGVDDLDVRAGVLEHDVVTGDAVEDHDVSGGEQVATAQGHQAGVARAGADEGDPRRRRRVGGSRVRLLGGLAGRSHETCAGWCGAWSGAGPADVVAIWISAAPSSSRIRARREPRTSTEPSSVPAKARSDSSSPSSPSTTSASAPTGAVHPASSVASRERSATTQARVSGSSSTDTAATTSSRSDRHSTARAPCPGAGSTWMGSITSVASSRRPRRARPARASTTASSAPVETNPIRVSTFPRIGRISMPSPRAASWAVRRGEPVPTTEPAGSSPSVRRSRATSTSRLSSRTGTAATTSPGSGVVGRSLSECTATSMRPSRRARRMAAAKTPVPPMAVSSSPDTSPSVVISTSSTSCPASRRRSATQRDWVVARAERRVPRRRALMAGPAWGAWTRWRRPWARGRRARAGPRRSRPRSPPWRTP